MTGNFCLPITQSTIGILARCSTLRRLKIVTDPADFAVLETLTTALCAGMPLTHLEVWVQGVLRHTANVLESALYRAACKWLVAPQRSLVVLKLEASKPLDVQLDKVLGVVDAVAERARVGQPCKHVCLLLRTGSRAAAINTHATRMGVGDVVHAE